MCRLATPALTLALLLLASPADATAPAAPPAAAPAEAKATTGVVAGTVQVVAAGKAKADPSDVVVYLVGFEQPAPAGLPTLAQVNKQFAPRVLAITAGQKVNFPNRDGFFHNVFSLSKARRFDLGQFKKGGSKAKTFPRKGIVEVYCNIHPTMSATILVLPNRAHARTDAKGRFRIAGVPPGTWTAYAYSRKAKRPARVKGVTVKAGATTTLNGLSVKQDRQSFKHKNKYGEEYKKPSGRY